MTPKELGAFVKATRERLNIDIYLFSCKMDMSRFYLEELEKGNRRPSKRMLGHIADALGIDVSAFYPANTPNPTERPTEASGGQETVLPDPFTDIDLPEFDPWSDPNAVAYRVMSEESYRLLEDELSRTQHQLIRALESLEECQRGNKELQKMYSFITEMALGNIRLSKRESGEYRVRWQVWECQDFTMLLDAWKFMVGKAKESNNG